MKPAWQRRRETEELLAESETIRAGLLSTAQKLDRFVAELRAEVDRLHDLAEGT